jgi:thiol-disulfide isomerase/thioredoxin
LILVNFTHDCQAIDPMREVAMKPYFPHGPRSPWLWALAIAGVFGGSARADDPQGAQTQTILHLSDGGSAAGKLVESSRPGYIRWQAADFVSPFEFKLSRVNAVHWPPPAVTPRPSGDFCFGLAGGDVLFGSLLGLNDNEVELDIPRIGRLVVERKAIHRIYRWRDSADLIYLGPNGMTGWRDVQQARPRVSANAGGRVVGQNVELAVNALHADIGVQNANANAPPPVAAAAPQQAWHEESGQILTDQPGASVQGDFGIPARANIEFEISWRSKPDFVLAIGTTDAPESVKHAFRFEAWGGDLIVQRELPKEADLAVVQGIEPGPGRAHLQVYLDQEKSKILVFSSNGRQLASLQVGPPNSAALPGLTLSNVRGDLRLEWLRISKWSGDPPREVKVNEARIHRPDGSIVYGQVTRFDPASREFVVRSGSVESRVKDDQISSVVISLPAEEKPRAMRAVYQDGNRLSGDLMKIEQGSLSVKVPGIKEAVRLSLDGLRSLIVLDHPEEAPLPKDDSTGRLELEHVRLTGHLVDGSERPGASALNWKPLASETASAMAPAASGRIVYKEPPPPPPAQPDVNVAFGNANQAQARAMLIQQQRQQVLEARRQMLARQQPPGVGNMVLRFAQALGEEPATSHSPGHERKSLYLRDGDVIPSVITKIDGDGVWFKSTLSTSTFVRHEKVKAVELATVEPNSSGVQLTRVKLERLLTLPRMQKADPPTHLIRSKNGDYLRGRIMKMDNKTLQVEVRLENQDIPRDRIARIIWLHADELDASKKPAQPAGAAAKSRVQVLKNDGIRLTFTPEKFADSVLVGKSEVLGPCQAAVKQIDQLLIGQAIETAAGLAFEQWKLKNAPEPKFVTAGDEEGGGDDSGIGSPLVGKLAPDFQLELLGGKAFHLADQKGKVIILDFWATWCGPCLQAMPQVERAADAFKDQDVKLVAVNLQETAEQVSQLLERQKLKVTVALDRDGKVADLYKASAIPQTVIIDREGKVARLFVGGGSRFEDQLREALKAVLAGEKPKEQAN